jgi:hypothetical protein
MSSCAASSCSVRQRKHVEAWQRLAYKVGDLSADEDAPGEHAKVVEYCQVDGDEKAEKVRVVAVPNAVVDPWAVMVCATVGVEYKEDQAQAYPSEGHICDGVRGE